MAFDPQDPNHPNADLFGDAPLPDGVPDPPFEECVTVETAARKTTGMLSPYQERAWIVQKEENDFAPTPATTVGIHAAKPQGFIKTAVDKLFHTKKVSGVIAVGAESVTVVKRFRPEEFKIGLQDYIDADSDE